MEKLGEPEELTVRGRKDGRKERRKGFALKTIQQTLKLTG
jgi:hypothetical protein